MSQPPAATSPQSLLWEAFRADPSAGDLYLPDSHIVFLPTGAGAAGEKLIRDFYQSGGYSHPKKLAVEETTIHRTVGESSAVDEVEVTVKFASGAGGWLLPGIEPHHLEDLTITFPLVICASFQDDHIASVRYMWDNASVLKMVRLIGSRHSWPIVAETQVDALRNPSRFRLNPFGNATSSIAGSRPHTGISNIFSATPPLSPPQSASVQVGQAPKKGHPALTSTVFSHLKNAPLETRNNHHSNQSSLTPVSPTSPGEKPLGDKSSSPTKKGHPALTSTLFNHLPKTNPNQIYDEETNNNGRSHSQPVSTTTITNSSTSDPSAVKKKGHPALTSTLFNHLKEQPQDSLQQQPSKTSPPPSQEQHQPRPQTPEEERGAGWRADYVKPKGHPALTSTLFSQPAHTPPAAVSRPYKKTSHNIFGPPPPTTTTTTATTDTAEQTTIVEEPQEQQQPAETTTTSYTLEPSAIEAELERHEQQQEELREAIIQATTAAEAQQKEEELQKEIQTLEALAIQEKALEEEEQALKRAQQQDEQEKAALVSPTIVTPPRKLHPNYRTSFTIGGPR